MSAEYAENNNLIVSQEIKQAPDKATPEEPIVDFADELTGDVLSFWHKDGCLYPINQLSWDAWFKF